MGRVTSRLECGSGAPHEGTALRAFEGFLADLDVRPRGTRLLAASCCHARAHCAGSLAPRRRAPISKLWATRCFLPTQMEVRAPRGSPERCRAASVRRRVQPSLGG